jgi:hypothetical protein
MEISEIITALGGIIIAWFGYNQYTKNKKTDYEIEKLRTEDKVTNRRRSDNAMIIFGVLWELLYAIKADRVYIVQPHPLGNEEMLSIYFEVKRRWAEPMKPHIQRMRIAEVAKFASELVHNLFMYIKNVNEDVKDRYAQSIFASCGTTSVIVKRLSDNKHDWVGSIVCEYTDPMEVSEEESKELLHKAATNIQYILPEIRD